MNTKWVRAIVACVAAAAIAFLGATTAQAQTQLRWNFKKDDNLKYSMEMIQKQVVNVMGNEIETTMTQTQDMTWKVTDVKDGVAQIVQTLDRVRMKMDSMFAAFDYDSKDGKAPEGPIGEAIGPIMGAMVGAEFKVKMNAQGEVLEAKVPDKILEQFKANPMLAQMGSMFSEDGMKNQLTQAGAFFPKEAVKKGDNWNEKLELKLPIIGTMKMNNTFTYQGPDSNGSGKVEKIERKSEMSFEPPKDENPFMVEIKVKSGDMKGTILFDNVGGKLVQSTMNQKMAMEITAMGNVIDSQVDQTIVMKLMKD